MNFLKRLFKKRSEAAEQTEPVSGNPARGCSLTLSVTGPAGDRTEEIDLVNSLAQVLEDQGRTIERKKGNVVDRESGIVLKPGIVSFQPHDDLSMSMCTTIEISHPTHFPNPFFEYQHSVGDTGQLAVNQGFTYWAEVDWPVLLDALRGTPSKCHVLRMTFPGGRHRRAVLGPVHYLNTSEDTPKAADDCADCEEAHPPFCTCCLFTRSMEGFKELLESSAYAGIRLFAARDAEGQPAADCRINGEDFEIGKQHLIEYAKTWPPSGYQFRKQYVLIQDDPQGGAD